MLWVLYILGEVHLGNHKFFSTYVDVCRIRPGEDEDWTVGMNLFEAYLKVLDYS